LPDPLGGIAGAFAVLNALRQSESDGFNRHIDLSQLEVCTAVCGEEILAASVSENASAEHSGIYRCQGDDEWIVIEISSSEDAAILRDVLGCRGTGEEDPIADGVRRFDKFELVRTLQERGVSAFGVLTNVDLTYDPSLRERGAVIDVAIDGTQVRMPGFPIPSLARSVDTSAQSPKVGQDSTEVLKMIGYDTDQILALVSAGVVHGPAPD
jgi:crotonobetainyl-CoA:carnitine CoA-transferase CaiB-like acyl-CoA transferase